jgi:FkbM family methyltransferase
MEMSTIPKKELDLFDSLEDIDVVFDVGARTDLDMFRIKPKAEYHLFEPNPDFYNVLSELLKNKNKDGLYDKVKVNPYGLGDKNEMLTYYTKTQSCINKAAGDNDHVHVKLARLDDYVDVNKIQKIDYLKIDTEGFDYKVMEGGIKTIKNKVRHIQFEYWSGVRRFLKLLPGFELSLMLEPVLELTLSKYAEFPEDAYLIALDEGLIDIIDNKLIPLGVGGNIFGEKL